MAADTSEEGACGGVEEEDGVDRGKDYRPDGREQEETGAVTFAE